MGSPRKNQCHSSSFSHAPHFKSALTSQRQWRNVWHCSPNTLLSQTNIAWSCYRPSNDISFPAGRQQSLDHAKHASVGWKKNAGLRCPETLFISHENANFLFSVFRVVQGEAKTPKIMGCCRANFAFLHALKIGTFRGKWTLEWVIKTSHFVLLALYFFLSPVSLLFL